MPPRASQPSKSSKKPSSSRTKLNTLKFDLPPTPSPSQSQTPPKKKFKPLTAFARIPVFDVDEPPRPPAKIDVKGKGKATNQRQGARDDRLWVDIHEPTTEAELAVHKKKVDDVRRWFVEAFDGGPSGKLKKYRRILVVTGPAGTAKTATVRVLARELGFETLEWRNTVGEAYTRGAFGDESSTAYNQPVEHEALMDKFEAFLTRALTCQNIFASAGSSSTSSQRADSTRQVVLLEDLPNILHAKTQERFHAALNALVNVPAPGAPVVIVISDAGVRGGVADERMDEGGGGGKWGKDVVDIRSVIPSTLLGGPFVTQISFNPIAPTLLRKALKALLTTQFANTSLSGPSAEVLDVIVDSANGDIRSAIMALQFACVVDLPGTAAKKRKSKGGTGGSTGVVLDAVARREQSLALFHLMGKVLYNKRKGDPPNPSATAKDIQREKEIDARLKDPPSLPPFLADHERPTSRVDVDTLYADSPIDSSLYSLYIHQNYPQFCDDIDHCEGVSEWMSWVDSSGGESWHQANPHRFHLLTLGTLHSLPSPVTRRSQKMLKSAFFDAMKSEREAEDAVRDVGGWLLSLATTPSAGETGGTAWRAGGWTKREIAMELGGVLKARDKQRSAAPGPATHRLFSSLPFVRGGDSGGILLREGDDAGEDDALDEDADAGLGGAAKVQENDGGWLAGDDIEDF
ncbi:hypothetical protein PLICRDRAFT_56696 [Plicaturopsis crispa FD-325 SS-3]|nr:hypothetical protein PLICRDRAFT_56696 [Plicaturopsis crispa FD-325 SS-3]